MDHEHDLGWALEFTNGLHPIDFFSDLLGYRNMDDYLADFDQDREGMADRFVDLANKHDITVKVTYDPDN